MEMRICSNAICDEILQYHCTGICGRSAKSCSRVLDVGTAVISGLTHRIRARREEEVPTLVRFGE